MITSDQQERSMWKGRILKRIKQSKKQKKMKRIKESKVYDIKHNIMIKKS
jgi:hypothetical protein